MGINPGETMRSRFSRSVPNLLHNCTTITTCSITGRGAFDGATIA